jgi:hypothetical protein
MTRFQRFLLLVAATVLSLALVACGGSSDISSGSAGNDKTTTTTAKGDAPYVSTDGFSAVFPVEPDRQEKAVDNAGSSLKLVLYQATTNTEVVSVNFTETAAAPTGDALQASIDSAIKGSATNVKGTVTHQASVTFLGVPAIDGTITIEAGVIRERVFWVGNKLYILQGLVPSADKPHPHYDTLLDTFTLTK